MTDDKTIKFNLPLPHEDNLLEDDVGRIRTAFSKVDTLLADSAESLKNKADMAEVKRLLEHKENSSVVDEKLAQFVDATNVALQNKADKTAFDDALALKTDTDAFQAGMESKADLQHGHTKEEVLGLGTAAPKDIFISTASPSGGKDGDIWIQYV